MFSYHIVQVEVLFCEQEIEGYIHTVRDVLFVNESQDLTDEERQSTKELAFERLLDFLPGIARTLLGPDEYRSRLQIVFDALQSDLLNKQVGGAQPHAIMPPSPPPQHTQ